MPIRHMRSRSKLLQRKALRQLAACTATTQGLIWLGLSGLCFSLLNTCVRAMTLQMDPFEAQFLRYLFGLLMFAPWVLRDGWHSFKPKDIKGQFVRGALHTAGLLLWFTALPKIALADMTAISFTGPLFIMLGAALFLGEPMRHDRWLAALVGFWGVLWVVHPRMSAQGGWYHWVMLGSAPLFAASFLMTKALTRYETAKVIVFWQSLVVTVLSFPLALLHWQHPALWQWLIFILCGALGSLGHYCLTRAFDAADISATQSVRFLDLIWSASFGYLVFGDVVTTNTLVGGLIIFASTVWIARRETRRVEVQH